MIFSGCPSWGSPFSLKCMKQLFNLAGLFAIGYLVATWLGGALADRIKIDTPKIQIIGIRQGNFALSLIIPVLNNTPIPLPFDSFMGQLLYGGTPLANVLVNSGIVISPGERINITADVRVPLADLTGNLAALISSGQYLQSFRLVGNAVSANVVIPIDQDIRIL